jgi:NAD(P)-dependent dehydrogenase (short-subunit alcohol dehydrogenase family)
MSTPQDSTTPQPFRLDGRHALVTGGASGIGEATVKELARAGAFLWIADINSSAAEALAASVDSAKALPLDVTNPNSIAAAVAQVHRLDILVNNAGIGHVGSIEATEPADFDRLLNVNVRAVYLVTRAFLPLLLAAGANGGRTGTIVNIGSVAGLVGIKQRFAYCTTKGAVIAMTRQLAVEYPKTLRVMPFAPAPWKRHLWRAILRNSTKTTRLRSAPNCAPASPSDVLASRKKSHGWCATSPRTKPHLSLAPFSISMVAGRLRNLGGPVSAKL